MAPTAIAPVPAATTSSRFGMVARKVLASRAATMAAIPEATKPQRSRTHTNTSGVAAFEEGVQGRLGFEIPDRPGLQGRGQRPRHAAARSAATSCTAPAIIVVRSTPTKPARATDRTRAVPSGRYAVDAGR